MENKDLPQIDRILDSIKTELGSIRAELKASLKTELDSIRAEVKAEINNIKSGESPSHVPPPPPPHGFHDDDEDEEEKEAERAERGPRFGPGFPFDTDMPEIVRGAIDNALGGVASGRESERTTKEFQIKDFAGIEIGGSFEVEIIRADSYSVSLSAEEGLFRNLDVSKDGSTLRIGHSRHIGWRAELTRPRARITMPVLKELMLSGATRVTVSGFSSSEAFKLSQSGASSLSGDITAGNAQFELSGASRARLTGTAKDVIINASGANHMDLGAFSVHNVSARLSGASRITVKMDGRLDARLSGVSHFNYTGNPTMGNIRTSGASRLSKE